MSTVALITCARWPDGTGDDQLLQGALREAGLDPVSVVWDDPSVEWAAFSVCVVRSTWDYHHRVGEFTAWVESTGKVANLWNRPDTLVWNSRKTYLADLERLGIPIVPTVWLHNSTDAEADLATLMVERGWERAVIKPTVSASAFETILVGPGNIEEGQAHIDRLLPARELMVQPFMASIHGYGERSHLFIDGTYSHTVKRPPMLGHDAADGVHVLSSTPAQATPDEIELATCVLDAAGRPTLYARVDLVEDDYGVMRLMELELIEPDMFFRHDPTSIPGMVRAIQARLH